MPLSEDEIKALQEDNARIKKEFEEFKAKNAPKDPPKDPPTDPKDEDFYKKFQKQKDDEEKTKSGGRAVEKAVEFNYSLQNYLKDNEDIFPSDILNIVKQAEKEKFDSASEKANTIKSSFIQSFYSIQANLDLLTPSQKQAVEDFLKLSVKGRADKAADLYENVFEPSIALIKRVKKADELAKAKYTGGGINSKADNDYLEKLKTGSQKAYLRK